MSKKINLGRVIPDNCNTQSEERGKVIPVTENTSVSTTKNNNTETNNDTQTNNNSTKNE